MSLSTFKKKWLGKRVDYDGFPVKAEFQCVDLIKQYLAEEYKLKPGAWGNANHYWERPVPEILQKFTKVKGAPRAGDIIVLKGDPGHIAIALDSKNMLEQNGATGDGDGAGGDQVRVRAIPVANIAGLLRPKEEDMYKGHKARYWYDVANRRGNMLDRVAKSLGLKFARNSTKPTEESKSVDKLVTAVKDVKVGLLAKIKGLFSK